MSINPYSLPPELQVDYYVLPAPPADHRFTCEDCDVTWIEPETIGTCWICGAKISQWRIT